MFLSTSFPTIFIFSPSINPTALLTLASEISILQIFPSKSSNSILASLTESIVPARYPVSGLLHILYLGSRVISYVEKLSENTLLSLSDTPEMCNMLPSINIANVFIKNIFLKESVYPLSVYLKLRYATTKNITVSNTQTVGIARTSTPKKSFTESIKFNISLDSKRYIDIAKPKDPNSIFNPKRDQRNEFFNTKDHLPIGLIFSFSIFSNTFLDIFPISFY